MNPEVQAAIEEARAVRDALAAAELEERAPPDDPLAHYDFRDPIGHPLRLCQEYQEMLEELTRLRGS